MIMPHPDFTPDNLHTPNKVIAANLAGALLTTPRRPAPNSAKKRRQMSHLSRPTATPGHGAKMSMIFRDATTSLQGSTLPPCRPSSNIKAPRLPLSQARSVKFGSTYHHDTVVSSRLGSPSKRNSGIGEFCELEWASSDVSRYRASGGGPPSPTPKPLFKADRTTFGASSNKNLGAATRDDGMCLEDTLRVSSTSLPRQIEEGGKGPVSHGFATPIPPTPNFLKNPKEVKYPILENLQSLPSSSNGSNLGSDSDDLHSTHGVPLILPMSHPDVKEASRCHIDTWLNGIMEATTIGLSRSPKPFYGTDNLLIIDSPFSRNIAPNVACPTSPTQPRGSPLELTQGWQSPSRVFSNKENISPSKCSSPTPPTAQSFQTRTPSRFRQTSTQPTLQDTKALHSAHPLTPQGHLNPSPQRKRARVKGYATASKDFTVHEDQIAEALAQLSPAVERHRKGRGPKRERCMSYWDQDILQPSSQCMPTDIDDDDDGERGGSSLGESKQTVELTTEKAGSASFKFKA